MSNSMICSGENSSKASEAGYIRNGKEDIARLWQSEQIDSTKGKPGEWFRKKFGFW